MPEGHLVSTPPLCQPCSAPQDQAESGGMVLVAYAGPVRPAAALRASVLCLPTDIHSLFVNKPSSSSSSSSSSCRANRVSLLAPNEHSPRTCTAGTVALTQARCLLTEANTTLLDSTVA